MSAPTWKLRIVRDDDALLDWPWMVDGYVPARHMGKDSHTDYTVVVYHFATYATALDFAALVLRMLRNPEARASDVVHPHAFEAGELAGELRPHAGPDLETREEEYLREHYWLG